MENLIKLHKNFLSIFKYSDTQVLGLTMNCVLVFLNPLIFMSTVTNCPLWLVLLGVPFGMFSNYSILINCYEKIDLSYTLVIGQILGVLFLLGAHLSLVFPFVFQLVVFVYLKWRASKDLSRKIKKDIKNG